MYDSEDYIMDDSVWSANPSEVCNNQTSLARIIKTNWFNKSLFIAWHYNKATDYAPFKQKSNPDVV